MQLSETGRFDKRPCAACGEIKAEGTDNVHVASSSSVLFLHSSFVGSFKIAV